MKKRIVSLITLLSLAGIGWLGWRAGSDQRDTPSAAAAVTWKGEPPTLTVTDAGKIFERAFWRQPAAEDQILHAERREWRDKDGLQRWQWFLVVSASPGLITYLREENAFGLLASPAVPVISEAPAWFRFNPEDVSTMSAPQASMGLMFSKKDNTLYATASGRGFTKGAPEPAKPLPQTSTPGRLPTTLPPVLKR
jgi:hypothetical protein